MHPHQHQADPVNNGVRLYSIGEAAELIGVSVPTLRLYEREGLLIPLRRASGHRLYDETDLHRLRCIRKTITEDKVSIAGMKRMLALIPCWNIRGCTPEERKSCTAFTDHRAPCWSLPGKAGDCATASCRSCAVYTGVADCESLKKTISLHTTQLNQDNIP